MFALLGCVLVFFAVRSQPASPAAPSRADAYVDRWAVPLYDKADGQGGSVPLAAVPDMEPARRDDSLYDEESVML